MQHCLLLLSFTDSLHWGKQLAVQQGASIDMEGKGKTTESVQLMFLIGKEMSYYSNHNVGKHRHLASPFVKYLFQKDVLQWNRSQDELPKEGR